MRKSLFLAFSITMLLSLSAQADIDENTITVVNDGANYAATASASGGNILTSITIDGGQATAGSVVINCQGHQKCSNNQIRVENKENNVAIGNATAGSVVIK